MHEIIEREVVVEPTFEFGEARARAELARWLDWGEAPWVIFGETAHKIASQPNGGENASR